jgi:hypothetical protein
MLFYCSNKIQNITGSQVLLLNEHTIVLDVNLSQNTTSILSMLSFDWDIHNILKLGRTIDVLRYCPQVGRSLK